MGVRSLVVLAPSLAAALLFLPACAPVRPDLSVNVPDVEWRSGIGRTGASWLRREGPGEGILVARLEGDPYTIGAAFGRLGRGRFLAQEKYLDRLLRAMIPNDVARTALLSLSRLRIRTMDRVIPRDLLDSIAGLADGSDDSPDAYERILSLHALHDVSQRFVDAPALAAACTGFLASGPATETGGTLLARNFDFEGGAIFDREKVVSVVVPDGKIPYLAVGFSGMLGVVSGFNREGIGVALQSISGGESGSSGLPMTLLMADVLQSATTFEEAIARIRKAPVFVSDLILLGDGKTGEVAVLEKTPSAFAVRRADASSAIAVSNEAQSDEVRRLGRPLPAGSTSRKRRARMAQLLVEKAPLSVSKAVDILRDRRSATGADLGHGNRNAIDGLIAAHSIVFDLTALRAYVAAAPHTLGAFVSVDLRDVISRVQRPTTWLPEDPFLSSGGFQRYQYARRALTVARALEAAQSDGWLEGAAGELERAHRLAPDFAELTGRLAELTARLGQVEGSLALFDEALTREPGPEPLRKAFAAFRAAVAGGRPLPPPGFIPAFPNPDEQIAAAEAR